MCHKPRMCWVVKCHLAEKCSEDRIAHDKHSTGFGSESGFITPSENAVALHSH